MINWSDVNSLQKQKLDKEIELNELLKSKNVEEDKVNELKSEILYLEKQVRKKVGSNEIKRQEELKLRKSGIEQRKINNYYGFKSKYEKINRLNSSFRRFIYVVDSTKSSNYDSELVRVKI